MFLQHQGLGLLNNTPIIDEKPALKYKAGFFYQLHTW